MTVQEISRVIDGKRVIVKKPELLIPAGNLEKLKVAIHYGADAVYLGGQEFGLRSNAGNFTLEEMAEGVEFAKKYGAKIYVTTNIFAHNENMDGLEEYLKGIEKAGVTGIIVADPLIIETCKRVAPSVEVHLSTQQSLSNWKAAQYWKEEGLHRGGCCQSCRWDYDLVQTVSQHKDAKELPLFQEEDAHFAMSPKDLNLILSIPKMIEIGIDSLKVEGRMKSIHYVATVATVYRKVIDAYCADPDNFEFKQEWLDELDKCANRDTAPAFFEGVPGHQEQMFGNHSKKTTYDFAGLVLDYNEETGIVTIEQRNHFKPGHEVEFFGPEIENFTQTVEKIWDEDGNELDAARHPLQIVKFKVDQPVYVNNMMRKSILQ